MMNFSEQLLLISVDPVTGRFYPVPEQIMNLTLAGALLFDASFSGLINDDREKLTVLKAPDSGNNALDEALRCLLIVEESMPLEKAVELVAAHAKTLRRLIMDGMLADRLLKKKKGSVASGAIKEELFHPEISLVVDLHKKIRNVIHSDEIPDLQMPALISLMVAGNLTRYILKHDETERFGKKINWLAGMESLGREIIRAVRSLEKADLEKDTATLIGLKHDEPMTYAGGIDAVLTSLTCLYKETGMNRGRKILGSFNKVDGFECTGCAWPNPERHRSHFEFCENGVKNVSAEATTKIITSGFFQKWSVQDLLLTPENWLEQQGRLAEPMILEENATHYTPVSWKDAFEVIGKELNSIADPDKAVFYASGRTSNEAAFFYSLFARVFGTNNLPNSANLCHEPSSKALTMSLGHPKSSVSPGDFTKSDSIFIFGHNPGSNHPRMLGALQAAVRKGSKIVAVNPMREASLMGFADPQEAGSYLGKQTRLAHLYLQPLINGDMALVRGMAKAVLEAEEISGNILDHGFIGKYTSGFQEYKQIVAATSWDDLLQACGLEKDQITEAANIYINSGNTIATWCLGITHHKNSIETLREIINLMLLKGNIGRPGAGICPVRGHSNIQGIRTAGSGENMPVPFLEALEKRFLVKIPRKPGMGVIASIKAMHEGKVRVLISLGGNLASAVPDTVFTEEALQKCRLTVMISTKLNRSHLITGKKALILPCLGRSDEDYITSKKRYTTIEDTMGKIGFSRGCLPPLSPLMKSEIDIIAGIALSTLPSNHIGWQKLANDYNLIREAMNEVIPAFKDIHKLKSTTQGHYIENPLRNRIFKTEKNRALFSCYPLQKVNPAPGELILMTIRSHDQFNTSIFGLNDRYRGISNERRVLFMNSDDMSERKIQPEQLVEISSSYDDRFRKLEGYYAIPYPVKKGCVAAYFPETNILTSINNINLLCGTPAYKSVRVLVK